MSRRHLSRIGYCRKSVDTDVGALDPLTAPSLSALKAVWWTRQLLQAFTDPVYDATHFYDQSGHSKDLLSGASLGTAAEGHDTALVLDSGVPNTLTRGDALGLAADPALTIAFKARFNPITPDIGSAPTILALGTAATPELIVFATTLGAVVPPPYTANHDIMSLTDFTGAQGATWDLGIGTLIGWHSYVMTKPAGSGYDSTNWVLTVDGNPATLIDPLAGGALALGNQLTDIGDEPGGGFPFGGHLAGMLVFNAALSGADLARVQAL